MKVETGCLRRKELWEGALALDLEPAIEGGFPEGSKLGLGGGSRRLLTSQFCYLVKLQFGCLGFPFETLAEGSTEPRGSQSPSSGGVHPIFQQAITLPLSILYPGAGKILKYF